jgi:hypothetical protein
MRDYRFQSRLSHDPAAPVVVLSPHLDDAVTDCWSVLTGTEPVAVVTVFARIPAPGAAGHCDALAGARDRAARMRERLEEDRAALALAGRSGLHLTFPQADHRTGPPPPLSAIDRALARHVPSTYRSQFSMLDRGPTGLLSNPAVHGYEVFWTVPTAR